jgi:hypothetical protein
MTTGNVQRSTSKNTPTAASQSSFASCGCVGGSGMLFNRRWISSNSAGVRTEASNGGRVSAMMLCASFVSPSLLKLR